MSNNKPGSALIALDLDEVLGHFVSPLCTFHNATYNTTLTPSSFHSYRFCEVWGGDDASATSKVHAFFRSPYFRALPPIPGAVAGVRALRDAGFRLAVVTSRQLIIADETRQWLKRHFPEDAFEEVLFGNHWGLQGKKVSKGELCAGIGANLLVDDAPKYVTEVAGRGIPALLFDLDGQYGWAKHDEPLPEGVTKVAGWDDVVSHAKKHL